jgi:hypothetical protein
MNAMIKLCPKCGGRFECNINEITKCACFHVSLNREVRELISQQYNDCLCIACLQEFIEISSSNKAYMAKSH